MKTFFESFIKGALAGVCIALGGTVFLLTDSRLAGALLFTVGLFTICTFGFSLYTGKICYVFERDGKYALALIPIWLGNLAGTVAVAELELLTRQGAAIAEKAKALAQTKLDDGLLSIFILSVLCDVLIYIAVEGFSSIPHQAGKYLALFFGVVVFIMSGFEHCVANMYYFAAASSWTWKTLLRVVVMTLGNSVGGVLIPLARMLAGRLAKKQP